MKKNSISLVINTKNEEKNIKDCIKPLVGFVDEIIVVDMHSSDKTREIAKKLGAKVFLYKDVGYVEPARNFAINKASSEWVLLLDADERVGKKLQKKIKETIRSGNSNIFSIPRKNFILNKWVKGNNYYWPDYQLRLFKKSCVKWGTTIHSVPLTTEKISYFKPKEEYAILHLQEVDPKLLLSKIDRYSTIDDNFKKYVDESGFNSSAIISYLNHEFRSGYILKEGYKDGFTGFILFKLMETYRFSEVAKFWINNNQPKLINESDFIDYYFELYNYQNSFLFKLWRKTNNIKNKFLKFFSL